MSRKAFSNMKKYCIICGKEFRIYTSFARNNSNMAARRSKSSQTCSKKCSRLYNFRNTYNNSVDSHLRKLILKRTNLVS